MNRSSIIGTIFAIAVFLLIPATAQSADIEVSDACSLTDAITASNTDEAAGGCPAGDGVDTISLSSDIRLTVALPHITSEITIEGGGFTISGDNRFRIFAANGGNLTVNELTMTKGYADWGGAIANLNGAIAITNSEINDNSASEGGAIGNDGSMRIVNSDVSHNSAEIGGGIYSLSGGINLINSTLNANTSEDNGGAVAIETGMVTFEGSVVSRNTAEDRGGAIWGGDDGQIKVLGDSHIYANHSLFRGGGIASDGGTIEITSSNVSRNKSGNLGGGIYCEFGKVTIKDSVIDGNIAESGGGGIRGFSCPTGILNSTISNNSVKERGGRYIRNGGGINIIGSVVIDASTIIGNSAEQGGGMWGIVSQALGEVFIVRNSSFVDNAAIKDGGGIYVEKGEATLIHLTIAKNTSNRAGGIYKHADGKLLMHNSIIAANRGGDCFGRLTENTGNLIEDGSCFPALVDDPMLGELIEPEDGSPAYYSLLEGSPAVDAADDEYCPDTDIIGTPRPRGAACDIGAYELPAR